RFAWDTGMSVEMMARALGLHRAGREFSGKCPSCGYPSGFTVTDQRNSAVLVYCHAGGCSQRDLIEALRILGLWPQSRDHEAPTRIHPRRRWWAPQGRSLRTPMNDKGPHAEAVLAILRRSHPAAGTLTETYLRVRGYCGRIPPTLRFAEGKHPS